MDVRNPLFQNIALIVAGVLFLNPIVATAAQLAVDQAAGGNTAVTQAQNGVPMVNIATPNGSGLSHNKFTDYNVGQQGLILNNSAQSVVQTQLGGYVVGNPNLKNGAAGLILNEVTGGNASQLKGYTEVAGRSAAVIVANPHGITCDGCGFINTPRVTLSTGTPVIENGRLQRFDVDGGQIAIEGAGLNAGNVDQFDLITRSAQINAELHAKKLNIVTGRSEVDATTLAATAKADDGSNKPMLAIDSSALGGMYAGAIRLVGTEQGVGVKLAGDMAASAGDIQIDAHGKLSLARVAASRDLQLQADEISLGQDSFAGRNARIEAQRLHIEESLSAGASIDVEAAHLTNAGTLEAGVRADGSLNAASSLAIRSDVLANPGQIASHGALRIEARQVDNREGSITSAGAATLQAGLLGNRSGQVMAQGDLELQVDELDNRQGMLLTGRSLSARGEQLDNRGGTVASHGQIDLQLNGALSNDSGLLEAGSNLTLVAGSLSNGRGQVRALGSAGESHLAIAGMLDNDNGLLEVGSATLRLDSGSLTNIDGDIRHLGTQGLQIDMTALGLAGGRVSTESVVTLSAQEWVNRSLLQAASLELDVRRLTQTVSGGLLAAGSLVIRGEDWHNDGRLEAEGDLSLLLSGDYRGNGSLVALGDIDLQALSVELGSEARVLSGGRGRLVVLGKWVSRGRLTAGTWLELSAQTVENRGALGAGGLLSLIAEDIRNEGGLIFSGNDMTVLAQRIENRRGDVYSLGNLLVAADAQGAMAERLDNLSGTFEAAGRLDVAARQMRNARETFDIRSYKYSARLVHTGCTDCGGDKENATFRLDEIERTEAVNVSPQAQLLAGGNMTLRGDMLDNRYSLIAAGGDLSVAVARFANQGAQTGDARSSRNMISHRVHSTDGMLAAASSFTARNWHESGSYRPGNINADINSFIDSYIWSVGGPSTPVLSNIEYHPAIVQAAGGLSIEAGEQLNNSLIRPSFSYVAGGSRDLDTQVPGDDIATTITLNPHLPPDLQQKMVDPLALPGFALPGGQNGLFSLNTNPGHRYLIETNPAFANLGNFLNSDYMLGLLGFDPDEMQRRLGDGLYEQRLVRDAILARTGQRYLAGLDSDEAQFRYLMDNALASKEALNLSLGITLSAEQIAALTHDIVWMEEREVQGQKVLVPVLYLAQAEGRLAPSGALIQGRDVTLISGGDLNNSGTLRATQNLSLTAQQNIANSGLMHANERLSLLAGDSIRNTQGGILKGQDVSLVAVTGDVVNERTVSTHHSTTRHTDRQQSFVDSAARIEAGNDLLVSAGKDIRNIGGAISAGGDASLQAGNDLILGSAEGENRQNRWDRKGHSYQTDITQYGGDVQVGGDLTAVAGRDLLVVGSRLKAGGSLELRSGRDLLISSAANESHSSSQSKKATQSSDQVIHQSSIAQAGQDVRLVAGSDLALIASRVQAGNHVDINAGEDVQILSAKDESASYYFKSRKGSFGRSKSEQRESYGSTNIASVIEAGNDLTINTSKTDGGGLSIDGGRDVTVIGSQLSAGNDLLVGATGDVAILSGVEEHGSYSKKTKSGFLGMSKSGKSQLKTSATQVASELEAGNDVVIAAGNDVRLRASTTEADNDVELRSGLIKDTGDINLVSANDTAYSLTEQYKKKTGLSVSDGMLSASSAKKAGQEARSSTSVGSHIAAERDASLLAERDINVIGSSVSAGRNLLLDAGRDVNVTAAQNHHGGTTWERERRTGIGLDSDRNGFTAFVGNDVQIEKGLNTRQTAAASSLDAGNDLDVRVGRDVNLSGSDFSAGRDINVIAERDINLDAATERYFQEQQELHQRNGLTVNVSHNFGNTVDAIKGIGQGENLVSQVSGVFKAADAVTQFVSGPTTANHLGTTRQQTTTTDGVLSNRSTTMDAGRDVNLQAGNEINAKGSQIQAERDITMSGRDITLDIAHGSRRAVPSKSSVRAVSMAVVLLTVPGPGLVAVTVFISRRGCKVQRLRLKYRRGVTFTWMPAGILN